MKANKKILGASAALALSLAMAAGSTFAWFTTGNSVSTEKFQLGVKSSTAALRISAGSLDDYKTGYKTTLSGDEILNGNGYYKDAKGALYHHVTTDSLFTTLSEDKTAGEKIPDGAYKRTETEGSYTYELVPSNTKYDDSEASNYKTTDVYVKFDNFTAGNLYTATKPSGQNTTLTDLTAQSTYSNSVTYWTKVELDAVTTSNGTAFTDEKNDPVSENSGAYVTLTFNFKISDGGGYGVYLIDTNDETTGLNATDGTYTSYVKPVATDPVRTIAYKGERIEADKYGKAIEKDTSFGTKAAYATRLSFTSAASTKIWAPYDNVYGTAQADNATPGYEANTSSFYKGNLAADYKTFFESENNAWPAQASKAKPETSKDDTSDLKFVSSVDSKGDADSICALDTASGEGSVTVRIWIDGADGDCFNSILTDTLNIKMSFVAFPNENN